MADQELSHSNPLIIDAAFVYSQTIAYLLHNASADDRATKAFDYAVEIAKNLNKSEKADESISNWLQVAKDAAMQYETKTQENSSFKDLDILIDFRIREDEGLAKHGFTLAFYFLLRLSSQGTYEIAIRETI